MTRADLRNDVARASIVETRAIVMQAAQKGNSFEKNDRMGFDFMTGAGCLATKAWGATAAAWTFLTSTVVLNAECFEGLTTLAPTTDAG